MNDLEVYTMPNSGHPQETNFYVRLELAFEDFKGRNGRNPPLSNYDNY